MPDVIFKICVFPSQPQGRKGGEACFALLSELHVELWVGETPARISKKPPQTPAPKWAEPFPMGCSHQPLKVQDPEPTNPLLLWFLGLYSWSCTTTTIHREKFPPRRHPCHAVKSWVARLKTLLSMDDCHLPQFLLISAWT